MTDRQLRAASARGGAEFSSDWGSERSSICPEIYTHLRVPDWSLTWAGQSVLLERL